MTSKRHMASRFALPGLVWLAIGLWCLLLVAFDTSIPPGFLKPASWVTLAVSLALFAFKNWAWRWRAFSWIAQRPDLRGTWKGTLASNYIDPKTQERDGKRDVFLVIHQTCDDLYVRLLTKESQSATLAAAIENEPDGRHAISSVYRNDPEIQLREQSPIHYGGMRLQLGGRTQDRLKGSYWTDRGTYGSLELTLMKRAEALDFEAALEMAQGHQEQLS